jgi:hypothetical protein
MESFLVWGWVGSFQGKWEGETPQQRQRKQRWSGEEIDRGDEGSELRYNISLIRIVTMNPPCNEYILIKNLFYKKRERGKEM